MMKQRMKCYVTSFLILMAWSVGASAKEMKDTLFSAQGDRVIISYSQTLSGGQLGLRFNGVQKKLSESNLKKFKKLDEVAVVIFDRVGNYRDMKFDGMATTAFMVPSDIHYSTSSDGYFLLQDNPSLQFNVTSDKANLSIPIYLAHYEGKRHYKVFAQCGMLKVSAKAAAKGGGGGGGNMGQGQQGDVVISSEELIDEGVSPVDEAAIRINSLRQMLEKATKVPFSDELTHEASMLRELRFKVTDEALSKQIDDVLSAYDDKKQQLEQQSDASQQAAAAQAAQQAQQEQARQDSIRAAEKKESKEEKNKMMWLIGGLGGLFALLMGGKQVFQQIKNSKMQKMQQQMQQQMMRNIQDMANKANPLNQMGNPLQGMGPLEQVGQQMKQSLQTEMQQQINSQMQKANQQINNATKQVQQAVAGKQAGAANQAAGNQMANANPAAAAQNQAPQIDPRTGRVMSEESRAAQQRLRDILAGRKGQTTGTESNAPKISITPGHKASLNDQIPTKYKRLQKSKKSGDTPSKK
jgi:hypothetical protein